MPVTTRYADVLDIDHARIARAGDGAVLFDDPGSPWVVRVWIRPLAGGRPGIARLRVDTRDPRLPINASRLARLPTRQILHIAAATATAEPHPNEIYYRMLARPKPAGQRGWPDTHWPTVLTVHDWAVETRRRGGGAKAVADMWGVSTNPTAYRWLDEARRRAADQKAT